MFNHTRSWLTPQPKKTCSTCCFYRKGMTCHCPKMVFGYNHEEVVSDCVEIVDSDRYGVEFGPDFGCIHHTE